MTQKAKQIDPKEFGKYHNTTRLETIILDCEECKKPTTHIYMGNFGVQWKPQYIYSCMNCKNKYISLKKLK